MTTRAKIECALDAVNDAIANRKLNELPEDSGLTWAIELLTEAYGYECRRENK